MTDGVGLLEAMDLDEELEAIRAFKQGRKSLVARQLETVDVAALRDRLGVTQDVFSKQLGVSRHTLRKWEQGQRQPQGPARALLDIVQRHPDVLFS